MHDLEICSTAPVSSRGLLDRWTCITYSLREIQWQLDSILKLCPSGTLRLNIVAKVYLPQRLRMLLNYRTPCQCIQIRIGMNQATTSPHTGKRNHLGVHTFYLTTSHLLHHALKNQHPKRHICQHKWEFVESWRSPAGEMPSGPPTRHGCKERGVTLRLEPIFCIACFSFIGFWYWFWLVEFTPLNFKGSIWAIQNGATWSWSNLGLYL